MKHTVEKNQIIRTTVESVTSEGHGVCKIDGFVVFVPQTAAGDICDIRIVKVLGSHGYGIVEQMYTPSSDRADPDCLVYRQCGGCCFRHLTYEAELRIKEQAVRDAFMRLGGISAPCEPILPAPSAAGYRNKAQYPVETAPDGTIQFGFYASRSHRLVPCGDCPLQPHQFAEIAKDVCRLAKESGIDTYNETTHKGFLRHIYLRTGETTGEIMLCLIVSRQAAKLLKPIAEEIRRLYPAVKSVVMNLNSRRDNVILGADNHLLAGEPVIRDTLCGLIFELSPLSFYQVNRTQAERLYAVASDYAALSGSETVIDLYCGVGTIGLSMANRAGQVIGVEIVPGAVEDAKKNAAANGIPNAEFFCADAKQATRRFAERGIQPEVVLLDPPRKGCDTAVIEDVVQMAPERVVMISCNPATAARDCRYFQELGYRVERYRPVDMFPRTKHVECVILLRRVVQ